MKRISAIPFLTYYDALVEDITEMLGLEDAPLSRDYIDLARVIQAKGVEATCFVSLPEICSDLEYSLEIGWYKRRAQGPLTSMKGNLPRLFHTLYLLVFTPGGVILEEPSSEAIRFLRQLLRGFKKFDVDCPDIAKEKAVEAFIQIECELPCPNLTWGDDNLVIHSSFPSLVDLVSNATREPGVRAKLDADYPGWDEAELLRDSSFTQDICDRVLKGFGRGSNRFQPKHGPGAVAEKFSFSKYEFPSWPLRLEQRFPYSEWGLPSYDYIVGVADDLNQQVPARLIAVPKTYSSPRLIASEPISAQFIQQGIMGMIRKQIKQSVLRHSIDINDQEPSKELALKASLDRSLSTIDLSSASDRLSCAVVECVFRRSFSFLEQLNAARTPSVDIGSEVLACKKFAAQGAAFTFPVQSIVYAMVCAGVISADKPNMRHSDIFRKVRVYGDDMIVPTHLFRRICILLTAIHLRVNSGKSFSEGYFRESCGMDAYMGHNVTPAYVRSYYVPRKPTSIVSTVECSNALYLKGFIRASAVLLETLPKQVRKYLAYIPVGSTALGIVGPNKWARRRRFNADLQRYEVKCLVVESKVSHSVISGQYRLHQWFIEKPDPEAVWSSGEVVTVSDRHVARWIDESLVMSEHIM